MLPPSVASDVCLKVHCKLVVRGKGRLWWRPDQGSNCPHFRLNCLILHSFKASVDKHEALSKSNGITNGVKGSSEPFPHRAYHARVPFNEAGAEIDQSSVVKGSNPRKICTSTNVLP